MSAESRIADALRWMVFALLSWFVLRPILLITIVYDDFYNPIRLREDLGVNPLHIVVQTIRDLNGYGHFNYIGQSIGALIYVFWDQLMAWGVRYSLIYAATKLVIFLAAAVVAARFLRTLAGLVAQPLGVWRSRVIVALALFVTLQLHVPWSYDPVGNFPLWGYLSVAIGLLALDLAVRTLADPASSTRQGVWSALALCGAILYYEINVAMVCAIAPIVLLLLVRLRRERPAGAHAGRDGQRDLWRRAGIVVVPPTLMTIVLAAWASHANQGYDGTRTEIGARSVGNLTKVLGGSLPAVSWPTARDWFGGPFQIVAWTVVAFAVVAATLLILISHTATAAARAPDPAVASAATVGWLDAVLVAASPLVVWLAASVIQGFTVKLNDQAFGFAYVYGYYAYGSVALVAAAFVLCLPLRTTRVARIMIVRPILVAVALAFAFVQLTINENVQRRFDEDFPGLSAILVAYSDQPPEPERCASVELFLQAQPWAGYYAGFARSLDNTYREHHGEGFCLGLIPP